MRRRPPSAGFTLIELLIAIVVLLVGIVAVAKMVPTAIDLNYRNRYESTALILAQRELEQIMARRLTVTAPGGLCPLGNPPGNHYAFCDREGDPVALGRINPGVPVEQVGCPEAGGVIDFSVPCNLAGYRKTMQVGGPAATQMYTYELRWNVVTSYTGTRPTLKRIMIAVRGIGARLLPPTTLTVLAN